MSDKFALSSRQVKVTNLNFQPEKAGDELAERVDMSIEMLLEETDVAAIVRTTVDTPKAILWDDNGYPALLDAVRIPLNTKAWGRAVFGSTRSEEDGYEYEEATLKKLVIEPMINYQAKLTCQVRIDPTGTLEELGAMRIAQSAIFSFAGVGLKDSGNKDQTELPV